MQDKTEGTVRTQSSRVMSFFLFFSEECCVSRKEKTVRIEMLMLFRIKMKHLQNFILSIFLEAVNMN